MNALQIDNLTKHYKNFTLNNVSFNIPEGTIMGLIGENGAGKSTIINLITGAAVMDSGQISIYGKLSDKLSKDEKAEIGTVISGCGFPEELTASDVNNIMKSVYKQWDSKKFFEYIERFSLYKKSRIKTYSTGMKVKLEIAIALSHNARLLILDEVTNGLDPSARMEILDMLLDFIQDEKRAVLISSHIIGDLEKICDYITFIHKGKIVFSENKDDILDKYAVINVDGKKMKELDDKAVISVSRTNFSEKALVYREAIPLGFETEKTSIEDIMLYYIKRSDK